MSLRMYSLMTHLVGSMPEESARRDCASAVRLHEQALSHLGSGQLQDAIRKDRLRRL